MSEFEKAANDIKNATELSNETKLKLYGLYKQANIGDNDTSKPYFFNQVALAKWNAWNSNKGTSKDNAKEQYVSLVKQIINGEEDTH